jgi:hypothetical protein
MRFLRSMAGACLTQRERLQCRSFLASRRLLWSPLGRSECQIVPWAARAMALGTYEPDAAMLLRYAIVPLPLVSEALGKCFELEARERSLYWPMRRECVPTPELEWEYARFMEGSLQSISPLYPKAAPCVVDPWCFASMGEFFSGLPKDTGTDHRRNVKLVRNALSHGHSLSWNMLKLLRSAENALLAANRSLSYQLKSALQKT